MLMELFLIKFVALKEVLYTIRDVIGNNQNLFNSNKWLNLVNDTIYTFIDKIKNVFILFFNFNIKVIQKQQSL